MSWRTLLILLIIFLLAYLACAEVNMKPTKKLEFTLGKTLEEVQQMNPSYDCKIDKINKGGYDKQPFFMLGENERSQLYALEYKAGEYSFTLPPTWMFQITFEERKLDHIEYMPQVELLDMKEIKEELKQIIGQLEQKHWLSLDPKDLDTLEKSFVNPNIVSANIGSWFNGRNPTVMIDITLDRRITKERFHEKMLELVGPNYTLGNQKLADKFLISISITKPYKFLLERFHQKYSS